MIRRALRQDRHSGNRNTFRPWAIGFTLVELLVVISIVGVLASLLLPAIQSSRETARRSLCQSHIKQICLALQSYHDVTSTFPAAVTIDPANNAPERALRHEPNWVIRLLPHLEMQNLHDTFTFHDPVTNEMIAVSDPANREARGTSLELMLCPTDGFNQETLFAGRSSQEGDNWARGNYGSNAALGFMVRIGSNPAGGPGTQYWEDPRTRGVMGLNVSLRLEQVTDGTSNTLLLGELRAGVSSSDPRGVWALGAHGSSSLWGHGADNGNGPNACQPDGDGLFGCGRIRGSVGGTDALAAECMSCDSIAGQGGAKSLHPGGINAGFVDGSVRYLHDDIDKGTQWELNPEKYHTWQRLCASGDGQAVVSADY
ncbi:MAG: DUF1559 domain-containing protein [Planctomycetota bacterium]